MFQFPGFALNPLCIQELSTFFRSLLVQRSRLPHEISLVRKSRPAHRSSLTCAVSLARFANLFGVTEIEGGFPHSEISGSKPVRSSPKLIAAYHVLHRLSAPRHPPNTLKTLDCSHNRKAGLDADPSIYSKRPFCFKHTRDPRGQAGNIEEDSTWVGSSISS